MRKALLLSCSILSIVLLTGCEKVQEANEKIANITNKAVTKYCSAPKEARQALHGAVKKAVAPNEITITCNGDLKLDD